METIESFQVSEKVKELIRSHSFRRWVLLMAALAFSLGLAASVHSAPEVFENFSVWPFLAVAAIGAPVMINFTALEMILIGKIAGRDFTFLQSLKIAVIGGAANMLPLPGATIVRIAALSEKGASIKSGAQTTIAVGVIWLGIAALFSGYFMGPFSKQASVAMLAGGSIVLIAGLFIVGQMRPQPGHIAMLVLVKLGSTSWDALRLMFCLWAIDIHAGYGISATLAVAGVAGSAVSIIPAGLGVREGVSAVLAGIAGFAAAAGFLAAAINRIAGLTVLIPLAVLLSFLTDKD